MFRRQKTQTDQEARDRDVDAAGHHAAAAGDGADAPRKPQPKGRPTPRRRDQVAARKQPLVAGSPAEKKAAKQAQREKMRELRAKQREAMETGDERYLPERDRGAQRRFVRDWVDARTGIAEWMLVVVIVFLFISLIVAEQLRILMSGVLWAMVLVVLIEAFFVARAARRRVEEKFGEPERGIRFYAIMRTLQIRRLRLPKPQVKRGERPS
ncbi:DUF3043 domain-containing protein [Nesterenkonia sp. F]|uniref:DUF3043 domain-containing protein n=1 Tax=Nesterenkonia sp. F TaxID=795955 RepID=UPI000255D5A0|nr:DUF3043 domain-containing protein [Nesterenkonia sp. F]